MTQKSAGRRIFVTGTGTGIGKTVMSAILAEALHADYWKPVQAGTAETTDADWVRAMMTNRETKVHPEAYRLQMAASPHIAAANEHLTISIQHIIEQVPNTSNHLVVEGAGGLMVPLNDNEFVADLILALNMPVILVSRNLLGSINHSILTAMACKQLNIPVMGWVFNDDYLNYEKQIAEWTGLPVLASIPHCESPDKQFISKQAETLRSKMNDWPW